MLDLSDKPDLGYIFYPSKIPHYPGHPRLDVILTELPTERHFDPTKVQFQIAVPPNSIERLTIHHPWTFSSRYRVCAGRVFITDRLAKKVEAFSFGGTLEILSDNERTVCTLTSPAPIFDLCATHNLPMWLTSEVEILLAEQNARWQPHHHDEFDLHLSQIDPLLLYASCLQLLQAKHWPVHEETYGEGAHFVREEIARLKESGLWPPLVPPLSQLFSASHA